jgi:molybdopterin synthase catalytic subunit
MRVRLSKEPFLPFELLSQAETELGDRRKKIGASSIFIGSMRDFNDGACVKSMYLEHHPEMTVKELEQIVNRAQKRWSLDHVLVVHRIGEVYPSEPIVLVAVWAAHRAYSFDACRDIMESLKSNVPFWKKEKREDGERWVTKNTPGSSGYF